MSRGSFVITVLYFSYLFLQDRKITVKAVRPHIKRMCEDEEAQLVLFTALDVIEYACIRISCLLTLLNSRLVYFIATRSSQQSRWWQRSSRTRTHCAAHRKAGGPYFTCLFQEQDAISRRRRSQRFPRPTT